MKKNISKSIDLAIVNKGGLLSFGELRKRELPDRVAAIKACAGIVAEGEYYRGRALRDLRDDTPHGEWLTVLAELRWTRNRASKYINYSNFAERLSAIDPDALAELDMTRWLMFHNCSEGELKEFLDGEEVQGITLDDAKAKTTKELSLARSEWLKSTDRELISQQEKVDALESDKRTLQAQNALLEARLNAKPSSPHFSQQTVEIREEAVIQHKKGTEVAAMLRRMLDEAIACQKQPGKKGYDDWRAATGTTFQLIAGLAAQFQLFIADAKEQLPEEFHVFQPDFILTDEEAETFHNLAAGILPEPVPQTAPKKPTKKR